MRYSKIQDHPGDLTAHKAEARPNGLSPPMLRGALSPGWQVQEASPATEAHAGQRSSHPGGKEAGKASTTQFPET